MKKNIKYICAMLSAIFLIACTTSPALATSTVATFSDNFVLENLINYNNIVKVTDTSISFSMQSDMPSFYRMGNCGTQSIAVKIFESNDDMASYYAALRDGGSIGQDTDDDNSSTTIWSTFYFTTTSGSSQTFPHIYLTKVTGGVTGHLSSDSGTGHVGNGVYISGSTVKIGQSGLTTPGNMATQVEDYNFNGSESRNWTIIPPSDWVAVVAHSTSTIGCNFYVTFTKNSSSWTVDLLSSMY